MNKILITLLLISNSLYISSLYSQNTQTQEKVDQTEATQQELETFVNKEKRYTLQYPASWQTRPTPDQFDLVLVATPKGNTKQITATMNVISEHVGPTFTLAQFFNENIPNVMKELKEANVEKTGDETIDGIPTKWALYTHTMNDLKLRVLQYFIIANENAYLLTFSAISDDFPLYKEEFEKIAASFRTLTSPPDATLEPHQSKPAEQPK